jgi:hypothetical protein
MAARRAATPAVQAAKQTLRSTPAGGGAREAARAAVLSAKSNRNKAALEARVAGSANTSGITQGNTTKINQAAKTAATNPKKFGAANIRLGAKADKQAAKAARLTARSQR